MRLFELTAPPRPGNLEYMKPEFAPGDGGWAALDTYTYTRDIETASGEIEVKAEFIRLMGEEDYYAMYLHVHRGDKGKLGRFANHFKKTGKRYDDVKPVIDFAASALYSFLKDNNSLTRINLIPYTERSSKFLEDNVALIKKIIRPFGKTVEKINHTGKKGRNAAWTWTIFNPDHGDPSMNIPTGFGVPKDIKRTWDAEKDLVKKKRRPWG